MCKSALYLLAIIIVLALIVFVISKIAHIKTGGKFYGSVKMLGNYLMYSALATFLFALVASFFSERTTVYIASHIVFICVYVLRAAVFYAMSIVREKRDRRADAILNKEIFSEENSKINNSEAIE